MAQNAGFPHYAGPAFFMMWFVYTRPCPLPWRGLSFIKKVLLHCPAKLIEEKGYPLAVFGDLISEDLHYFAATSGSEHTGSGYHGRSSFPVFQVFRVLFVML